MTNKRHPDKVHVGGYITKEEKQKLDQLRYEMGNCTMTDLIRMLINEQETYGKYPAPQPQPSPKHKAGSEYKYPKGRNENAD